MAERSGRIKFNIDTIKFMSIFTKITHTGLKDCIEANNKLIYIVEQNLAGKAIGKKGINVKNIERVLNKKIKIVEFNAEPSQFIINLIYPNKVKDIQVDEGVYTITPSDAQSRSMIIGRSAVNLREYENIVRRYFDVKEIKVK